MSYAWFSNNEGSEFWGLKICLFRFCSVNDFSEFRKVLACNKNYKCIHFGQGKAEWRFYYIFPNTDFDVLFALFFLFLYNN